MLVSKSYDLARLYFVLVKYVLLDLYILANTTVVYLPIGVSLSSGVVKLNMTEQQSSPMPEKRRSKGKIKLVGFNLCNSFTQVVFFTAPTKECSACYFYAVRSKLSSTR